MGRPREFCSIRCRRRFHHELEVAASERERVEQQERWRRELDEKFYGKREAARRAKWREQNAAKQP